MSGIFDDFPFGEAVGEAPFDVDDLGPLNLDEVQEAYLDDIGKFVRQFMQSDKVVMSSIVVNVTFACMMSGMFTYQQIGNVIAKVLIDEGGFHRRHQC